MAKKRKNAPAKQAILSKRLKKEDEAPVVKNSAVIVPAPECPGMIGGLIYEDELDVTTETLHTLAKNPNLISLKALKPFKTAVHDYWRVANETSLTGKRFPTP